jgi:hypothetical protein
VKAVRFTRAEREYLLQLLPEDNTTARKVAAKLAAAAAPASPGGISVVTACDAFRRVLRDRLILPLKTARGVYAAMQKRLTALGLSEADCHEIARVAGEVWEGAIRAESLVRQADKLLGGLAGTATSIPGRPGAPVAPVTLGDDDL